MSHVRTHADGAAGIWPNCPFADSQRICFQSLNPKKVLTAAFERYERYKRAQTVGEYLQVFKETPADIKFAKVDFQNDQKKGYLRLVTATPDAQPVELHAKGAAPAQEKEPKCSVGPSEVPGPLAKAAGPEQSQDGKADTVPAPEVSEVKSKSLVAQPKCPKEGKNGKRSLDSESSVAEQTKSIRPHSDGKAAGRVSPVKGQSDQSLLESLQDQSLSSLPHQTKKLEPKQKAARKEPKVKSQTSKPSKPSKPKSSKVLIARDLVRDVVTDYVEGQPDPPAKPVAGDTKSTGQTGSKDPMANRTDFVWVAYTGSHRYAHDPKLAQPLARSTGSRCDVCNRERHDRLYRVKCYTRRQQLDAVSESSNPRLMRPETYHVGARHGCQRFIVLGLVSCQSN